MNIQYDRIIEGRYNVYANGMRLGEVLGGHGMWTLYRWDGQRIAPFRTRKAAAEALAAQAVKQFPSAFCESQLPDNEPTLAIKG